MSLESSLDDLFRLMEQWRVLTHAETKSIRRDDWQNLERLQDQKTQLQEAIRRTERSVFEGESLPPARRTAERQRLRQVATELKRLELHNRDLLMRRLEETDAQLRAAKRTIRGLRNVQLAYSPGTRSFWKAYS